MRTYLLEKSRITSQLPDEQNYHVLYQVAACLPAATRKAYSLGDWPSFAYLNVRDEANIEWDQFPTDFTELSGAMASIPTVAPHAEAVWRVLAAVLHLGNANFHDQVNSMMNDSAVSVTHIFNQFHERGMNTMDIGELVGHDLP